MEKKPDIRVLLLEDNPGDAELIIRSLRRASDSTCHVVRANRLEQALALLSEQSFDVVLADLSLPDAEGLETVERLRAIVPHTAVIVLTGRDDTMLGTEALHSGAQDYIVKGDRSASNLWRAIRYGVERQRMKSSLDEALGRLERKNEATQQVLNQLQIATLVVDLDDTVVFVSEAASSLLSIGENSMIGRRWTDIVPGNSRHHDLIRQAIRSKKAPLRRIPMDWDDPLGKTRHVEIEAVPSPVQAHRTFLHFYDLTEIQNLRKELQNSQSIQIVGESEIMRDLYRQIRNVAEGDWTVLIEGETGVGKELAARSIHQASRRRNGPFIAVNCAALTESLLNSQLFGHRRGAFTGAVADSPGAFETASGGTLFLDEIGELPGQMQSSLLRVLQEKEIVRLGDSRARKVDVRVVAATNRDLVEEVRNGRFRQDLLYRIKVGRIEVPPLRQRKEDIPALAASFLARGRVESGKLISTVSSAAMEVLKSHDWPGNVRELRNAIDYAIIRCSRGDTLQPDHLPPEVQNQSDPIREPIDEVAPTSAVDERARIQEALHKAAGNRNKAAKLLGISRATLYRRLERYGIGPKFPR